MFSRIDGVLVDQEWVDLFEIAELSFLHEGDYDHTHAFPYLF